MTAHVRILTPGFPRYGSDLSALGGQILRWKAPPWLSALHTPESSKEERASGSYNYTRPHDVPLLHGAADIAHRLGGAEVLPATGDTQPHAFSTRAYNLPDVIDDALPCGLVALLVDMTTCRHAGVFQPPQRPTPRRSNSTTYRRTGVRQPPQRPVLCSTKIMKMRCLRPVLNRVFNCQIKNLRIFTHLVCSTLLENARRYLRDENFGSQKFF